MEAENIQFDTLDDFHDSITVEQLSTIIIEPIKKNAVGTLITGSRALAMGDGYWGKPIALPGGEKMQLRQFPTGKFGKSLENGETRIIATRTSGAGVFRVAVAILFKPRFVTSVCADSKQGAHTVGCRGVHILLQSLLNKHFARPCAGAAARDRRQFQPTSRATHQKQHQPQQLQVRPACAVSRLLDDRPDTIAA